MLVSSIHVNKSTPSCIVLKKGTLLINSAMLNVTQTVLFQLLRQLHVQMGLLCVYLCSAFNFIHSYLKFEDKARDYISGHVICFIRIVQINASD